MEDLCNKNGRRYFLVNFDGRCHNCRINIVKHIPSVKIRRDRYYSGKNQMMIGCNGKYCEVLLYELKKAKSRDGYCTCFELGYVNPKDILRGEPNYDK